MANQRDPTAGLHQPSIYQIRIRGQVGPQWSDWFEGLTVTPGDSGETLITGVIDQAALHGMLRRVRDLGLPLLSVTRIDPDEID